MRFVFYVFLFFVAISTLIVLAAAVRIAWTRVARPMPMSSDSAAQARSTGIGDGLLLAATALAWYNTASGCGTGSLERPEHATRQLRRK